MHGLTVVRQAKWSLSDLCYVVCLLYRAFPCVANYVIRIAYVPCESSVSDLYSYH